MKESRRWEFWKSGCVGYLDLRIAAIEAQRRPDWAAAKLHIDGLTLEHLAECSDWLEVDGRSADAKEKLRAQLELFQETVEWGSRSATFYFIAGLTLFIAEDESEIGTAIRVLAEAGVLAAAGFE